MLVKMDNFPNLQGKHVFKKSKKTLETTISRIPGFHVGVLGDNDPHFVEQLCNCLKIPYHGPILDNMKNASSILFFIGAILNHVSESLNLLFLSNQHIMCNHIRWQFS